MPTPTAAAGPFVALVGGGAAVCAAAVLTGALVSTSPPAVEPVVDPAVTRLAVDAMRPPNFAVDRAAGLPDDTSIETIALDFPPSAGPVTDTDTAILDDLVGGATDVVDDVVDGVDDSVPTTLPTTLPTVPPTTVPEPVDDLLDDVPTTLPAPVDDVIDDLATVPETGVTTPRADALLALVPAPNHAALWAVVGESPVTTSNRIGADLQALGPAGAHALAPALGGATAVDPALAVLDSATLARLDGIVTALDPGQRAALATVAAPMIPLDIEALGALLVGLDAADVAALGSALDN